MQYIKFSVNLGPGRSGLLSRYVKATLASLSRWENYSAEDRPLPFSSILFCSVRCCVVLLLSCLPSLWHLCSSFWGSYLSS